MKKELFGVCPYITAQKVLTGKWSMYILYLLTNGPIRFNELQRRMPEEMTHTTLSRQLKKRKLLYWNQVSQMIRLKLLQTLRDWRMK